VNKCPHKCLRKGTTFRKSFQ